MPRGGALWPVFSIVGIFAVLFGLSFLGVQKSAMEMRFVREAPRASLKAPRPGPAIYSGTISGPDGRVDLGGNHAAATWWWVVERISKNRYETVCFEHQIDKLWLHDATGGRAALEMFNTRKSLSLFGAERSETWTEPLQIDLAELAPARPKTWPAAAQRCQGSNRSFVARSIPFDARVDVLACYEPGDGGLEGRLGACATMPATILAVDGIGHYLDRRAVSSAAPFLMLSGLAALALAALTFVAFRFRGRAISPVVPR